MQLCLFLLLLLSNTLASAQVGADCHCDQIITKNGTYKYDGKPMPNGTVCIKAGNYDYLQFFNYEGTEANPIRFINCGGKVILANGLNFYNCKFFKVSGSGPDYGIRIDKTAPGAQGVNVSGQSSDCEIEYIEVAGASFAGIMVKADPTCDPASWQGNLVMRNIEIHHNYIHDVGGEGLYIGNSFFGNGITRTCDSVTKKVYPHMIYGLDIHHNLVERTGAEGIQYGCAPDALVHHNVVRNTGTSPFASYQNNGIQIGGGAGGRLYNNIVRGVAGTGVIIIGHIGTTLVYNNLLAECGGMGIFCDDRVGSQPDTEVAFLNNTIIDCGQYGIRLYNEINRNTIANNVIAKVKPGPNGRIEYVALSQGATATIINNRFSSSLDSLKFSIANDGGNEFMPADDSPLIDAGTDVSSFDVLYDLNNNLRKIGSAVDIGAYEFMSPSTLILYPNPSREVLTVRAKTTIDHIIIYNEQGVVVAEYSVFDPAGELVQVPVKSLPAGTYLITVETTTGRISGRFMKL